MLIHLKGDATEPAFDKTIIVHCCNDIGAWGAGFVVPLGRKYPRSKYLYKNWSEDRVTLDDLNRELPFKLGEVQLVKVKNNVMVANLIGQRNIITINGVSPVRYDAIEKGLRDLNQIALENEFSIQMPKMGAGLAGGDWDVIEQIIMEEISVPVKVFTL